MAADSKPYVAVGGIVGLLGTLSLQRELGGFDHELWWALAPVVAVVTATGGFLFAILQGADTRRPTVRWPAVTALALALVGFGLEHLTGAIQSGFVDRYVGLLAAGALFDASLSSATWRAMTAPWLFGGTGHFLFSAAALWFVSLALAQRLNWSATLVTVLLPPALASLVVGGLAQIGVLTLGAAPAWAGLGGLLVAERAAHRAGRRDGPTWKWWGAVGLLLVAASLSPHAQGGAHTLSALLGAGVVALETRGAGLRGPRSSGRPEILALFGLSAAALVTAAGFATLDAQRPREALEQDLVKASKSLADANALNSAAWTVACDHEASEADIRLAEQLSLRSVELAPHAEAYLDTLATLQFRLGRPVEAARTELKAATHRYSPFFFAQIQRFLRAHAGEGGEVLEEDDLRERSIGLDRVGWGLVMWWPLGSAPMVLTEVHSPEGEQRGSVLLVATSSTSGSARYAIPQTLADHLDEGATLRVTWVRKPDEDQAPGLTYYPFDPEPDQLP